MSLWETFNFDHESKTTGTNRTNSWTLCDSPRKSSPLFPTLLGGGRSGRKEQVVKWGQRNALKKAIYGTGTGVDSYSDGTKVVYRKREDWSSLQGYAACAFLDEYDTVLACDHTGTVDLVRLPRYNEDSRPRKLGQVLVDNLETRTWKNRAFAPKMKSIQGGNAFVVGSAGSYHVYASERARKWVDAPRSETTQFSQRSPSTFISNSWTLHGPRRKYYRDVENPHLSLASIAASSRGNTQLHNFHLMLHEIQGWDLRNPNERIHPVGSHLSRRCRLHHTAKWDFIETNSSFMAVQVDSEEDSFWLQLVDDRVHEPVVCLDQTSRDSSIHCEEHITSCAFASGTCLATAHVTYDHDRPQQVSADSLVDDLGQHNCVVDTFVKLWDIRMLSAFRQENELSTIRLPQFPYESAVAVKPEFITGSNFCGLNKDASDFVICELSASTDAGGTIILSAHSRSTKDYAQHYLLNLGRLDFKSIYHQKGDQEQLLHSASGTHGVLACVENQSEISIIEVEEGILRPHGYKRRSNGIRKDDEGLPCQLPYRIRPDLKDRHGLETQLSCISLNPSGTSVLGGSIDGDLFVWRGF